MVLYLHQFMPFINGAIRIGTFIPTDLAPAVSHPGLEF